VIYGSLASPAAAQQSSCVTVTRVGAGAMNFVSRTQGTNGNVTVPVTLPGGGAAEDLIVLFCVGRVRSAGSAVSSPDYTAVPGGSVINDVAGTTDNDLQVTMLYKVHDGSEPNPTVTFTNIDGDQDGGGGGFGGRCGAVAFIYRCAKNTAPFDPVTAATGQNVGTTTNFTGPSVTTLVGGTLVVSCAARTGNSGPTLPTANGYGALTTFNTGTEPIMAFGVVEKTLASPAASGGPGWSGASAQEWAGVTMGLRLAST
jgi:hypothetical protein